MGNMGKYVEGEIVYDGARTREEIKGIMFYILHSILYFQLHTRETSQDERIQKWSETEKVGKN